jgi:hypothetical protein
MYTNICFMVLNIHNLFKIPINATSKNMDISLVEGTPVEMEFHIRNNPYTIDEITNGVYKPQHSTILFYDPVGPKLEVSERISGNTVNNYLFSGENAAIEKSSGYGTPILEDIIDTLKLKNFPNKFLHALERSNGEGLIKYLQKANSSIYSFITNSIFSAPYSELEYAHQDIQK